jgi:hypothetical protein
VGREGGDAAGMAEYGDDRAHALCRGRVERRISGGCGTGTLHEHLDLPLGW